MTLLSVQVPLVLVSDTVFCVASAVVVDWHNIVKLILFTFYWSYVLAPTKLVQYRSVPVLPVMPVVLSSAGTIYGRYKVLLVNMIVPGSLYS